MHSHGYRYSFTEQAQKQASVYASQTQALFDRFAEAEDERPIHGDVGEMSVDLMTAPARDEERQRLDTRFKELEAERRKFTEAAVRLGKEKATLEVMHTELISRPEASAHVIYLIRRLNASSSWRRNARGKSNLCWQTCLQLQDPPQQYLPLNVIVYPPSLPANHLTGHPTNPRVLPFLSVKWALGRRSESQGAHRALVRDLPLPER